MREWRKDNPDYYKTEARREAARAACRDYYRENSQVYRIREHKRRANGGTFTVSELNALFDEQEGLCYYCGRLLYESFEFAFNGRAIPHDIEHMIPVSRNGSNNIDNIVLACPKCNGKKNDKTAEEFLRQTLQSAL
jgi:5-methylcytosine-specific restriction endonuclease McrA